MRITTYLSLAVFCVAYAFSRLSSLQAATADPLSQLVQILPETPDPQFQLDILRGLSAAAASPASNATNNSQPVSTVNALRPEWPRSASAPAAHKS